MMPGIIALFYDPLHHPLRVEEIVDPERMFFLFQNFPDGLAGGTCGLGDICRFCTHMHSKNQVC